MKKWIQRALGVRRRRVLRDGRRVIRVLPEHPGKLHRLLGVPIGQKIPLPLMRRAAERPETLYSDPETIATLRSSAQLALRLRGYQQRARESRERFAGGR